jgi:hypothetical protein
MASRSLSSVPPYAAVLALAAISRTTTTATPVITNPGFKGLVVFLNITSVSGAAGVKIRVLTGTVAPNTCYLDSASRTTVSYINVAFYPGATASTSIIYVPAVLGAVFQIQIQHDTSDPITYTVSYSFIE